MLRVLSFSTLSGRKAQTRFIIITIKKGAAVWVHHSALKQKRRGCDASTALRLLYRIRHMLVVHHYMPVPPPPIVVDTNVTSIFQCKSFLFFQLCKSNIVDCIMQHFFTFTEHLIHFFRAITTIESFFSISVYRFIFRISKSA